MLYKCQIKYDPRHYLCKQCEGAEECKKEKEKESK